MPRFNHRRRSSRRKPQVPRAEVERRLRRRRVQGIFQGWGRPTPPTVREVQRLVARSNVTRTQSAQRSRRKEAVAASFRRAKSQRRAYWRRRLGKELGMGQGQGGSATTTQTPKVIPAQERRSSGMASKGPRTTLTPETALEIAGLLESGVSIKGIAERTGHPASTVRHWVRSGRVAALGRSQQNTANT